MEAITDALLQDMLNQCLADFANIQRKKAKPTPTPKEDPPKASPLAQPVVQKAPEKKPPPKRASNKVATDRSSIENYVGKVLNYANLDASTNEIPTLDNNLFIKMEKEMGETNQNQQIHDKLIFDAINEALIETAAEINPWINPPSKATKEKLVDKVQRRIASWQGPQTFALDNLSAILSKEGTDLHFEDEEYKLKCEIADSIFDDLLSETVQFMDQLSKRKRK